MLGLFRKNSDSDEPTYKDLDKVFEQFVSDNNISEKSCSQLSECRDAIYKLAAKIKWFEFEYNYVPDKAYVLLSKLSTIERKTITHL